MGTGELSYTATNWGTHTKWELGNFHTQLSIVKLTHTGNWETLKVSYQLGNLHTLETGKRSYTTTNWGTQTHRELSNFHTQLPIWELTHNGNWGTFIHSYQLGNSHKMGTGELSYTAINCETYTHWELGNFKSKLPIGELTHNGNWGNFIHSYQLGNSHTMGTGKKLYTAINWKTYKYQELGNLHSQLPIWELTHTRNWGTFIHSYQLGNSYTPGTGELSL